MERNKYLCTKAQDRPHASKTNLTAMVVLSRQSPSCSTRGIIIDFGHISLPAKIQGIPCSMFVTSRLSGNRMGITLLHMMNQMRYETLDFGWRRMGGYVFEESRSKLFSDVDMAATIRSR